MTWWQDVLLNADMDIAPRHWFRSWSIKLFFWDCMGEHIDFSSVQIDSPWGNEQFFTGWGWTDTRMETKNKGIQFRVVCCGEWRLIVLIQPESSLFLLLGSYHANNNSAQVKHCDISTFNPHRETFRSLEKYTQTKIINVSPYRVFSVFVCVCALNLEYIYLRSFWSNGLWQLCNSFWFTLDLWRVLLHIQSPKKWMWTSVCSVTFSVG